MKKSVQNVLKHYGILFALMSLIGLCTAGAFGQAIDGNIIGTVIDSQGAALAGAEINATSIATNTSLVTKTSATGEYRFDHLLAGTYRITVKVTGFKSVAEMVEIELNKTVTRNITLAPGAASETVEVSGIPPVLDTTTAQLQNTYQTKQLEDLPTVSAGSGVINLALLDAGVATSGGIGLGTGPSVRTASPQQQLHC